MMKRVEIEDAIELTEYLIYYRDVAPRREFIETHSGNQIWQF